MKVTKPLRQEEIDHLCNLLDKEASYQLDHEIMAEFIREGQVCEFKRCEIISAAGDIDTNTYILYEGVLRLWHWNGKNEKTSAFALPATLFNYTHSYYNGQESPNYYEACCRCRILRFSKQDFDRMVCRSHEFTRWMLSVAQCQLYYYHMMTNKISGNVKERYEAIERNRAEILQKVPLKIIASYLGVSPQYLSRIRKKI